MSLEQLPPNRPNFGLVVALSAVALVVILALGVLFIHWDGKHLTFGRSTGRRVSQLTLPNAQVANGTVS